MWCRDDLVATLRGLGLLQDPQVEKAFRSVRQEEYLPEAFGALAYADMPLPVLGVSGGKTMPSPRCLSAALGLLELEGNGSVLVAGARGGFPAALLAHIASDRGVVVAEPDESLRTVTAARLKEAGRGDVRVVAHPPAEAFDRILVLDPHGPSLTALMPHLADPGTLIARGRGLHDLAFVKVVRRHGETVQMTFNEAPARLAAGPRDAARGAPIDFGRLFAVEDLLVHAWEGRVTGHYDEHFRDVAQETFAGGPLDDEATRAGSDLRKWGARQAFQAAYILQSAGDLERAADAYERSLLLFPSAEAHTFLGWTYSFMGRYQDAIAECEAAIGVDVSFGNPYNDIGAYLIELGRLDEAIPWLEKAIAASRYCCYFYAHTNLARVYLHKRMPEKARRSLLAALRANPDYAPARELLRHLESGAHYFA
ncbi:MAG TPA: tetratricopeptide repeat protein [Thermoplasmata archaeon]|nr:tetratricopeptide repeat protein [Thermoplasmata archaeon]